MKTKYRGAGKTCKTCLACMTLVAGITSVCACSSNQNLNQIQPDSNQAEQAQENFGEDAGSSSKLGGGAGSVSSSGSGAGTGSESSANAGGSSAGRSTQLISGEGAQGFAFWSQGKLSVTDDSGQNLMFEIDPETWRTRTWANLEVDGGLAASGGLRSEWMSASGQVSAGSLLSDNAEINKIAALDLNAAAMKADDFSAGAVKANGIEASNSVFEKAVANVAQMASLTSSYATLDEAGVGFLAANGANVSSLAANNAALDNLEASLANISSLNANSVSAAQAEANAVNANSITSSNLNSKQAEFNEVSAANVTGGTSSFASANANSISAKSVQADSIGGVLSGFKVDSSSAGIAAFNAVDASGVGKASVATISVDANVDAVMVTPFSQGDSFQCTYEVENLGEGRWHIVRKFPQSELDKMSQGTFEPITERYVCWLAIDFG